MQWRRGRDLNPRRGYKPLTRLAGERLRPLGHLSVRNSLVFVAIKVPGEAFLGLALAWEVAEGVGFEPTRPNGPTVFKTVALDRSATPPGTNCRNPRSYRLATRLEVRGLWRRGWDSNPRRGVNPLRHFECRALDRTMRPLREWLPADRDARASAKILRMVVRRRIGCDQSTTRRLTSRGHWPHPHRVAIASPSGGRGI